MSAIKPYVLKWYIARHKSGDWAGLVCIDDRHSGFYSGIELTPIEIPHQPQVSDNVRAVINGYVP